MKAPDRLVSYAANVAAKVARRCNLDPDVTLSIAGELAVTVSARVETEEECFKLFSAVVKRRLPHAVIAELALFGPSHDMRRKRRQRVQEEPYPCHKEIYHENVHDVKPHKPHINMTDFLDQFNDDPKLQEYVLLVIAGHNQTELINNFGYTRAQILRLKEKIEHVYKKQ